MVVSMASASSGKCCTCSARSRSKGVLPPLSLSRSALPCRPQLLSRSLTRTAIRSRSKYSQRCKEDCFFSLSSPRKWTLRSTNASKGLDGGGSGLEDVVFLTREESKNGKLRASLHNLGIETYELPLVEHTRNKGGMEKLVGLLKEEGGSDTNNTTTWFVTTSPEAAAVFTDCWREAGCPSEVNIASIGLGTTKALQEKGAGDLIKFTPSKATGKVLARELPLHCTPFVSDQKEKGSSRVVYPSSELASNDVEEGLSKRGFAVKRINTYSTRPVESLTEEQAAAASRASIVTFGSPSAIRAWKHLVNKTNILCCCIGGTSHKACVKNGFEEANIFSPHKPGLEGWTRIVVEALEEQKKKDRQGIER